LDVKLRIAQPTFRKEYILQNSTFDNYRERVNESLSIMDTRELSAAISLIRDTVDAGNRLWVCGNGGSAATASHFATDLSRCSNSSGEPVKGISLCDNTGLITAIGNDFGFDLVFSRQLSTAAMTGDLFIVITASGNSKNLLVAMEWAKNNGVRTLAITGFDGGKAKILADASLHVPTTNGDYGVAEDTHSILCHFISLQFRGLQ
jgi:D-sedoheptulose 7-phosphate isomerase